MVISFLLIYTPQLEQLVAEQPLQEDDEEVTVSPPLPFDLKEHADITRLISLLPQDVHSSGFSCPKTRYSKFVLHSSQ
jgi:hypothetical protein